MVRLLVCIIIVCWSVAGSTQEWSPINLQEQFHYSNNGDHITHTIRIDSSQVEQDGETHFLNRIVAPCDTCNYADYGIYEWHCLGDTCLYLRDQAQFLMRQVHVSNEGYWEFQDPFTFRIRPNASVGDTWDFGQGQSATVEDAFVLNIEGVLDSVKQISADDGTSIRLSKEHGLLRLITPLDGGQAYNLMGIQERGIGQLQPTFEDIFDFQIGDVFQYRYVGYGSSGQESRLYKRTVTSVEETGDTIRVGYHEVFTRILDFNIYYGEIDIEEDFVRSDYEYLNRPVNSLGYVNGLSNPPWLSQEYRQEILLRNNRKILRYGAFNDLEDFSGSFPNLIDDFGYQYHSLGNEVYFKYPLLSGFSDAYNWGGSEAGRALGEGLGLCTELYFESLAYDLMGMIGYVKDGDTTGTIFSDSYLLSTTEQDVNSLVIIYPNPSTGLVNISAQQAMDESFLSIIDMSGRTVLIDEPWNRELRLKTLDLSWLTPGNYMIILGSEGRYVSLPFVKLP